MKVRRYTCPECGYTKSPTTHVDCGGTIVLWGGTWRCDACGMDEPTQQTICTRCAATVPADNVDTVEMNLDD